MIHVVGGVYLEAAPRQHYEAVFGSGGRGAAVLAVLGHDVTLHTAGTEISLDAASDLASSYGFEVQGTTVSTAFSFEYPHLAADPYLHPGRPQHKSSLPTVQAEKAVVYGMLEVEPSLEATQLVYDPQAPGHASFLDSDKVQSQRTAYVLNASEALSMTGASSVPDAAKRVFECPGVEVCVMKLGPDGGLVFTASQDGAPFPAYQTENVWPIGSGDVFTAVFAHAWFQGKAPAQAAALASRATAFHSQYRAFPTDPDLDQEGYIPVPASSDKDCIYLAAPFFTSGELGFVNELRAALMAAGATVFSPYHDVGLGTSPEIAKQDLIALRRATSVLGVADGSDPGTLFELGFARALDIPTVVLAERISESDLVMLSGSGCEIVRDTATAIYRAIWQSRA